MTDARQWYVLGLAGVIIILLGLWWAITTKASVLYILNSNDSASTTQQVDLNT